MRTIPDPLKSAASFHGVRLLAVVVICALGLLLITQLGIRELVAVHRTQVKYGNAILSVSPKPGSANVNIITYANDVTVANAPVYMHQGDSRLFTIWYHADASDDTPSYRDCTLNTSAFDAVKVKQPHNAGIELNDPKHAFLDTDPACIFVISPKKVGAQLVVYSFRRLFTKAKPGSGKRNNLDEYVTDFVPLEVGDSPLSSATIAKLSGALGILGALLAIYLQASGKREGPKSQTYIATSASETTPEDSAPS
jgi:hypothetical protein